MAVWDAPWTFDVTRRMRDMYDAQLAEGKISQDAYNKAQAKLSRADRQMAVEKAFVEERDPLTGVALGVAGVGEAGLQGAASKLGVNDLGRFSGRSGTENALEKLKGTGLGLVNGLNYGIMNYFRQ